MSEDELPSENLTLIGRAVSLADVRKILEEQPVDAEVSVREAGEAWEQPRCGPGKARSSSRPFATPARRARWPGSGPR